MKIMLVQIEGKIKSLQTDLAHTFPSVYGVSIKMHKHLGQAPSL